MCLRRERNAGNAPGGVTPAHAIKGDWWPRCYHLRGSRCLQICHSRGSTELVFPRLSHLLAKLLKSDRYCDFFRKAFRSPASFRESQNLELRLPTQDPEIFDVFSQWLYFSHTITGNLIVYLDDHLGNPRLEYYIRLYQLGDFMQCPVLTHDIIRNVGSMPSRITQKEIDIPSPDTVTLIYEELADEALPFRAAAIRRFLLSCDLSKATPEEFEGYPGAFWLEVMKDRQEIRAVRQKRDEAKQREAEAQAKAEAQKSRA